ncbi:hypothetical protein SELMODRAFT_422915 [Selaginella moellendorffii]|uniref:J domain-containing protein n=1 Tax=Selaginella moellendorffii TaxID=88036 RepID=D8SJZ0_SELML|nr:hypothetical protein SELMODRAFT_422915 [Selaginella moellendorffii]
MATRNLYEVLGLDSSASTDQIKRAYYSLAKQFHSDLNKGDSEAWIKVSGITILKDKKKREMYDKMGMGAFNERASNCADFSSAIHELMRAMWMQSSRAVKITLSLSFREAAHGCQNPVSFLALVRCGMCTFKLADGSGIRAGARQQPCSECRGLGKNARKQGPFIIRVPCSAFGGSGSQNFCNVCSGGGVVRETRTHDMRIPPVDTGMRIIMRKGDPLGRLIDLILFLKVLDDPVFWREREDVHMNLAIDFTAAILGGEVSVPTLSGNVNTKIQPGTQYGEVLVLKGKGSWHSEVQLGCLRG